MNQTLLMTTVACASIALGALLPAAAQERAAGSVPGPLHLASDGGDCGWFAISVCTRGVGGARRAANRYGGRVIDTGDVGGFRPGWYCAVIGPTGKRAARAVKNDMRFAGARSAYIKQGCLY